MEFYILCRQKPTVDEMDRSIIKKTDDPHCDDKFAKTRHAAHMIATACECGEVNFYPIDPRYIDMIETVERLVALEPSEPFEYGGKVWHRVGPLDEEDMEVLEGAAFAFFMDLLPVIEGVIKPNAEKREVTGQAKTLN